MTDGVAAAVRTRLARRGADASSSARAYVRWGQLAVLLLVCVPAVDSMVDERLPPRLSLLLAPLLLIVAAIQLRCAGRFADGSVPLGWLLLSACAGLGALLLVGWQSGELVIGWLMPLGMAASSILNTRGWRRRDVALVAVGAVLLVLGLAVFARVPGPVPVALRPVVLLAVLCIPVLLDAGHFWLWRILGQLELARTLAAEVAATRERARIAAELHDMQGHSLHVIAMHAELVERLVEVDAAAAAEHARLVRRLAADALAETRSLVHGYRTSDVAAEVRNAAEVLRAAGAHTVVRGDPDGIPDHVAETFAPLVREATTNILRHSTPLNVEIQVWSDARETHLRVTNDGVRALASAEDSGTGLRGLRERFAARGGRLVAGELDVCRWRLTGTLHRQPRPERP